MRIDLMTATREMLQETTRTILRIFCTTYCPGERSPTVPLGRKPVHRACLESSATLFLFLTLAAGLGGSAASAQPNAIPILERCTRLTLYMADGWWLQIRRNGPALYGFGALPQRVIVKEGTFSIERVYRDIIDGVEETYSDTQFAVVFSPMPSGQEGAVYALKDAGGVVPELFARAYRERDLSYDGAFQEDAIRHLDQFWAGAPFLQ